MDDTSIDSRTIEFSRWQRVRLDVFRMEHVIGSDTATRGGGYMEGRTIWSGPYWWWLAWVVMHLKPANTSWAVPRERRRIYQVVVPPSIRTWGDFVLAAWCCLGAIMLYAEGAPALAVASLVAGTSSLVLVPRLRGATRSAS